MTQLTMFATLHVKFDSVHVNIIGPLSPSMGHISPHMHLSIYMLARSHSHSKHYYGDCGPGVDELMDFDIWCPVGDNY